MVQSSEPLKKKEEDPNSAENREDHPGIFKTFCA